MPKHGFYELFVNELQDIYDAEKQIVKCLPNVINQVQNPQLKEALKHVVHESRNQMTRIEQIAKELDEDASGESSKAMKGLVKELEETASASYEPAVRDVAIICHVQEIKHFETAAYGTLRTFAKHLGFSRIREQLTDSLREEVEADRKLTALAEGTQASAGLNARARKAA